MAGGRSRRACAALRGQAADHRADRGLHRNLLAGSGAGRSVLTGRGQRDLSGQCHRGQHLQRRAGPGHRLPAGAGGPQAEEPAPRVHLPAALRPPGRRSGPGRPPGPCRRHDPAHHARGFLLRAVRLGLPGRGMRGGGGGAGGRGGDQAPPRSDDSSSSLSRERPCWRWARKRSSRERQASPGGWGSARRSSASPWSG